MIFGNVSSIPLTAIFLIAPSLALHAHPGHETTALQGGIFQGFLHPLGGLDHLLAMIAVGLWAAQIGGRALWVVPSSFLAAMFLGGLLGFSMAGFSFVEQGIALSVVILGVLIAFAIKPPLFIPVLLVAFFALFHGVAHATEFPANSSTMTYAIGFLLATALLYASGLAVGILAGNRMPPAIPRYASGVVAAIGAIILFDTI